MKDELLKLTPEELLKILNENIKKSQTDVKVWTMTNSNKNETSQLQTA